MCKIIKYKVDDPTETVIAFKNKDFNVQLEKVDKMHLHRQTNQFRNILIGGDILQADLMFQ